jgi:hypothetical protein
MHGAEEKLMNGATAGEIPASLPEYYRTEFQKIRDSNEAYKGKWNWAAFFAGPFWAFGKGMQAVVVVYLLAIVFTFALSVIAYAVIFGMRGNYMYYTKVIKGRNLLI